MPRLQLADITLKQSIILSKLPYRIMITGQHVYCALSIALCGYLLLCSIVEALYGFDFCNLAAQSSNMLDMRIRRVRRRWPALGA